MRWETGGDQEERSYGFDYDPANRLLKGDFTQKNGTGWDISAGLDFSMKMGSGLNDGSAYDANGNIKSMSQIGVKLNTSATIDNLTYNYTAGEISNKLLSVTEDASIGTTDNKLGDFTDKNQTLDDYNYDANGNLVLDKNKGINSIEYNYLNLPYKITVTGNRTITYIYDASGNKLEKLTEEPAASAKKYTAYVSGYIYENNVLKFFGHEEGRVRKKVTQGESLVVTEYVYDYFLKDHLGNVRMMLTDEWQKDIYPAATLESIGTPTTAIDVEQTVYDINTTNAIGKAFATGIPDYPNNNGSLTPPHPSGIEAQSSQMVYRLNSSISGAKMGLGKTLKVMAGDRLDIFCKSYYQQTSNPSNNLLAAIDIITGLLGAPGSPAAGHGTIGALSSNTGTTGPLGSFLNQPPPPNTPRAYVNYIFFDERFNFVSGYASPVKDDGGGFKDHYSEDPQMQNIEVPKNGYVYIYCSNETDVNVFFDNLQVIHTRGPLLEETHYYPFGLTMSGISSKGANKLDNKYKFNGGTELNTDLDINLYETDFRSLDPQIGRFHQTDPLGELFENESLYSFAGNNPINYNDPYGLAKTKDSASLANPEPKPKPDLTPAPPPSNLSRVSPLPGSLPPPSAPAPPPAHAPKPALEIDPVPIPLGNWLLRGLGVIGGVLIPYQAKAPGVNIKPLLLQPPLAPYPGNGNNKMNWNPHIVYEFIFTPKDGRTPILKYGISDEYKNSMERPELQLPRLKSMFGTTVTWHVYTRTLNRQQALFVEQLLVTQHVNKWGYKPRDQTLPNPW